MMSLNHSGIEIVKRDIEILKDLFSYKVLSRDQIRDVYFSGSPRQVVNRRLKKLRSASLVRRINTDGDLRGKSVFSLTPKGFNLIDGSLGYVADKKRFKSDSIAHDLTLYDISKKMLSLDSVKSYWPENVLQSCSELHFSRDHEAFVRLRSDAQVRIERPKRTLSLALEYDATAKSKERYMKKVRDYYGNDMVDGILYICANKLILKRVMDADQEVVKDTGSSAKFCFSLLDNVLNSTTPMTFHFSDQRVFKIP
jgi:hypothetical protein